MHILIDKSTRRLILCHDAGTPPSESGSAYCFPVTLGQNPAAKRVEGDRATPVGDYTICAKNPRSRFFRSLCLSYPNAADADRGLASGLIDREEHRRVQHAIQTGRMPPQHTRLGGEIYIHGRAPTGSVRSWTRGCIAVDDVAMQVLYDMIDLGTAVRIVTNSEDGNGTAPIEHG